MRGTCPTCQLQLRVRISEGGILYCHPCGCGLDPGFLSSLGVSAEFQKRIRGWGDASTRLRLDVDFKDGLDDPEFLRQWTFCRREISQIVALLNRLLSTDTVVLDPLEETAGFTDAELLRWRLHRIRLQLIRDYGQLLGINYVSEGNLAPSGGDDLPITLPRGLSGEEERRIFEANFRSGADTSGPTARMGLSRQIVDLERRLGLSR